MFKLIIQFFALLTSSQRSRFYALQILVVVMAFTEILGVASIIPFMALVGDMSQLQQDTLAAKAYQLSGVTSESQFVFLLGVSVLIMLFISAIISMFTLWRLSMFANVIGSEIADRLYAHYLSQSWLFHAGGSSAQLTKKIAIETRRVTDNLLTPLMLMNARIVFILLMTISIFFFDPIIAITGFSFFGAAYFILYRVIRMRLERNGKNISDVSEQRFRLMNEGFGGIKDILLLGRASNFISRFNKTGVTLANSMGSNVGLSLVPRYFIELLAFGSMISLVLYLIASYDGDLGTILPILSVYALASAKLLPAFQMIYASVSNIKGNISALKSIQQDIIDSMHSESASPKPEVQNYIHPKHQISLEDITFTYPGKKELTLNHINMTIPANSVIGIVGPSGSGKSTLIDILLGLIRPQKGRLMIDSTIIDDQNCRLWQNTIGFVAQSIFLSEGTIAENVAFGISQDKINHEKVQQAIKLAHLDEFLQSLDQGVHTNVGERGVQLSGGQRQRIGIARALYHEAEVIIFDEATSSLDGITEKMIMEAINNFIGKKTIVMIAHRLKTVQNCDQIFFIDKGQVVDQGTFKELMETNEHFKKMATHS
jgi:ATP-binding cassette, subfamily B, bacterial PglK